MRRLLFRIFILCWTLLMGASCGPGPLAPTVILVSLDGFRWDYLDKAETPHLDSLAAEGVRAERLLPIFPTKTFPNHYTIVTGLYAEHHGIVANNMWDDQLNARFALKLRDQVEDGRWWGGEPIWATVGKNGGRSASMFWPGSEAEIAGFRPTYYKTFDKSFPDEERVRQVLAWLDLPEGERPVFIGLYFSITDNAGHDDGPDAESTARAIHYADSVIGELIKGLERRGLLDQVNLMVVSDHGMAATSRERTILLDQVLDLEKVRVIDWNPVASLTPNPDYLDEALTALQATPHLKAYRREDLPWRWHLKGNPRTAPLLAVADEGWTITTSRRLARDTNFARGNHGFDNALRSMHGIFLARGPAFKQGLQTGPVENVDLYELMCRILDLQPAPNDGDASRILGLLRRH